MISASRSRDPSGNGTVGLSAGRDLIKDSGSRRLGGVNDGSTTSRCSAPSTTRVAFRSSVIRISPTYPRPLQRVLLRHRLLLEAVALRLPQRSDRPWRGYRSRVRTKRAGPAIGERQVALRGRHRVLLCSHREHRGAPRRGRRRPVFPGLRALLLCAHPTFGTRSRVPHENRLAQPPLSLGEALALLVSRS